MYPPGGPVKAQFDDQSSKDQDHRDCQPHEGGPGHAQVGRGDEDSGENGSNEDKGKRQWAHFPHDQTHSGDHTEKQFQTGDPTEEALEVATIRSVEAARVQRS